MTSSQNCINDHNKGAPGEAQRGKEDGVVRNQVSPHKEPPEALPSPPEQVEGNLWVQDPATLP